MFSICIKRAYEIDSRLPSMTFQVNKICLKFLERKAFSFRSIFCLYLLKGNYVKYIYIICMHILYYSRHVLIIMQYKYLLRAGGGRGQLSKRHVNKMVDNTTFVCSMIS